MADVQAQVPPQALSDADLNQAVQDVEFLKESLTIVWVFLNGTLVFLMQLGFAMLEVGSVRVFHMQNILIKNVVDGCITIAVWFLFGFALYSNGVGFSGNTGWLLIDTAKTAQGMAEFYLGVVFAASSVTIVSGAMAERCQLPAYFVFSTIMGGFVYPLAAHWVWNCDGWLAACNPDKTFSNVLGYLDYAGSSVVHALGGSAALVAVFVLGPRHGRFGIDGEVVELEGVVGNSGVYKVMGSMVLFVTWLCFNASSTLTWDRIPIGALAGSNTMISATFSCFTVMAWKTLYNRFEMNLVHSTDGLLAGCVGITAGASLMEPWAASVVGIISGILYTHTADAMLRFQLDDVVNAVSIHLTPGIWGCISLGLFAKGSRMLAAYPASSFEQGVTYDEGVVYGGNGKLLGVQVFGVLMLVAWCSLINLPLFFMLRFFKVLRIPMDAQLSVHSGFKPREAYQWNKYNKGPQMISLDAHTTPSNPTANRTPSNTHINSQSVLVQHVNGMSSMPPPQSQTTIQSVPMSTIATSSHGVSQRRSEV